MKKLLNTWQALEKKRGKKRSIINISSVLLSAPLVGEYTSHSPPNITYQAWREYG